MATKAMFFLESEKQAFNELPSIDKVPAVGATIWLQDYRQQPWGYRHFEVLKIEHDYQIFNPSEGEDEPGLCEEVHIYLRELVILDDKGN